MTTVDATKTPTAELMARVANDIRNGAQLRYDYPANFASANVGREVSDAIAAAIEAALTAPASAEPVAWAFFDQKGYEHFLRTGDRGFISDISVVTDFLERKSRGHYVTLPLYAGPPINEAKP